ncbi:hypothetical protein B0H12DRAFT_1079820 [Mycena haematopus]|nr:hypothetical protein B0H12DRAFT_1079820 [Mycena haematopus]
MCLRAKSSSHLDDIFQFKFLDFNLVSAPRPPLYHHLLVISTLWSRCPFQLHKYQKGRSLCGITPATRLRVKFHAHRRLHLPGRAQHVKTRALEIKRDLYLLPDPASSTFDALRHRCIVRWLESLLIHLGRGSRSQDLLTPNLKSERPIARYTRYTFLPRLGVERARTHALPSSLYPTHHATQRSRTKLIPGKSPDAPVRRERTERRGTSYPEVDTGREVDESRHEAGRSARVGRRGDDVGGYSFVRGSWGVNALWYTEVSVNRRTGSKEAPGARRGRRDDEVEYGVEGESALRGGEGIIRRWMNEVQCGARADLSYGDRKEVGGSVDVKKSEFAAKKYYASSMDLDLGFRKTLSVS